MRSDPAPDLGEGEGRASARLLPAETEEPDRQWLVPVFPSWARNTTSHKRPPTSDLVRKYRETSESDGRQIRQLDVERSEAIYAKNKMEHQQKILSSALETVRKESEMYSKALVDKEAEFASYRSSHVSVASSRSDGFGLKMNGRFALQYMELQQTLSERDREAQSRLQVEKARDQVNRQYQENLDALNSAQTELTALQNKLSKKSSDFRADAAALQKRIDSLENRSKEDREAVEGLEEAFREAQEAHAQRVEAYEDEIQAASERQAWRSGRPDGRHDRIELWVNLGRKDAQTGFGRGSQASSREREAQGGERKARGVVQECIEGSRGEGEILRSRSILFEVEAEGLPLPRNPFSINNAPNTSG
jgi:predicted  nucleic acid-binding Zn-ribbon protein